MLKRYLIIWDQLMLLVRNSQCLPVKLLMWFVTVQMCKCLKYLKD